MKTALIAGGGSFYYNSDFGLKRRNYDVNIAVDGGIYHFKKIGISPDYFVGDMDSNSEIQIDINSGKARISKEYRGLLKQAKVEKLQQEKDFTDLEYALGRAKKLNVDDVEIIGAVGTRIDHSLANINLLIKYAKYFKSISISDGRNLILPLKKNIEIRNMQGITVSISQSTEIRSLVMQGFKYPANGIDVDRFSSLLTSNEIVDDYARIDFKSGYGVVILNKGF